MLILQFFWKNQMNPVATIVWSTDTMHATVWELGRPADSAILNTRNIATLAIKRIDFVLNIGKQDLHTAE